MALKLNIGAGPTEIDGWLAIDRKLGDEAYPLKSTRLGELTRPDGCVDDSVVDEIRASHILEHFSFADARAALKEWVRVLKPGSRIRLAVPDLDRIAEDRNDPKRLFYLMGGQVDGDDYHRSAYDESSLRALMEDAGLTQIRRWESANTDCASLPISLNLEGIKASGAVENQGTDLTVKVGAYMTVPRYEATACRGIIESALKSLGVNLVQSNGVFYGQCMQRMFEEAVENEVDWILTVDSDSLFNATQISMLFDEFARHPEADAMAALQCRRGQHKPLMTCGSAKEIEITWDPVKVTTAHFGLTLIRVEALTAVAKPWFFSRPDENGEWGDDRLDDDIWFWHQWRLAEKTIYVAPRVAIGHLEEMVSVFDENLDASHIYLHEWRERFLPQNQSKGK